ncbi:MAG: DUF3570 domain-containing protein [Deltaproteobacteria bacterium]|nr:DUF3570 domain-containing protein [Deltaproteobacteria bacterium]
MANHSKSPTASTKITQLLSAALAIPGLGLASSAQAQSMPDAPIIRIRYADYDDYQSGKEDRISVQSPMVSITTPISETDVLEAGFTYDSVSGASPYYLSTLSGASGTGIHDNRRAGDVKLTHYFSDFSIGVGGRVSDEDDFLSRGGLVDAHIWTPDKNTTFTLGFSIDSDDISSTLQPDFSADRRTEGYLFGITQVLTENSIMQSNLSYTHASGYQSDPYKTLDNRPSTRDAWSLLSRYNLFFPEYEASLHVDYRFFIDSWGIKSHTLDVAWYQPVGNNWIVRPNVRYYSQCAAQFYEGNFPPVDFDTFYSADQRMGNFGSIGGGLKLIRELGRGFSADISFEAFLQDPNLKLGNGPENDVKDFYATFFSVGLTKKF